jgi:hypothetical protein
MTQAFTPTSATNKLIIIANIHYSNSAATEAVVALFQDSTAGALACVCDFTGGNNQQTTTTLVHEMTDGTVSATTFKIRVGGQTAGTMTFNGNGSGRLYGGTSASTLTILEVSV